MEAVIVTVSLSSGPLAWADNLLNSSETGSSSPATTPESVDGKDEFTLVPAAGANTDIGVAVGYFAALTRNQKGYVPYLWNLESAGLVSFGMKNGAVDIPYTDVYAKLTVPRLLERPIDLEARPSFTDERALYYYGMGNDSSAVPPVGKSSTYFQYARIHPSFMADVRVRLLDHVGAILGLRYTASRLDIPEGSRLIQDMQSASPAVRKLIGSTAPSLVALFIYGLQVDTRDSEVTPHGGTFDEAKIKWSPGGDQTFPFRYGEASMNLRGYVPISSRVTLAGRIIGDVLFGDPPFAELPRFEDTYAVGGSNGVRGVPAQRYYGKVKVIGNVEGRARILDFHAFAKPMSLGFEAFFDGGRVWADTRPHPELDGTGFGLKYGFGVGVRLTSGSAFVLRADLAWSPDAAPIGAYLSAGEMF
jgi:outer membrane protein assembly factor BamA